MNELNDEELVLRYQAQSGSQQAQSFIDELFGRHHVRVAAWCYRMTGDRDSAADFAQDIFLKAFRHLKSFQGNSKFTTWLYTIARNHCTNELRSRATRPEGSSDTELLDLADRGESADVAMERRNSEQMLKDLMQEVLDETELKVMTLHYGDELPLDAITRLLGLQNASGAKAHIVSARRKLNSAIARMRGRTEPAAAGETHNE
jgi:RNA polymerase sigma-70 factor (ECF subfamily)